MPLYWLCYRHDNQISVVIEPGASLIHARMRASLAKLDEGEFTEGHELDRKTEKQVPKVDDWTTIVAGGSEKVVG
jgi:hypothetical protein